MTAVWDRMNEEQRSVVMKYIIIVVNSLSRLEGWYPAFVRGMLCCVVLCCVVLCVVLCCAVCCVVAMCCVMLCSVMCCIICVVMCCYVVLCYVEYYIC